MNWKRLLAFVSGGSGLIIAGAIAIYLVGRWNQAIDSGDRAVEQSAAAWLAATKTRRAELARLKAEAAARVDSSLKRAAEAERNAAADSTLELALRDVKTTSDSLRIVLVQRDSARAQAVEWRDAWVQMAAARVTETRRADMAEAELAEGERHAEALLRDATTFKLLFVRLPRPPKWAAAVLGCAAGAYLDRDDARGCGLGAAALTVAAPTR